MPATRRIKSDEAPAPLPEPLDPHLKPPLDQYCDLVLKGGVVDGVIYPGVLVELARHYRFQSIAGTSVGAIAASLAAASEYSRRFGSDDGFNEVLRKIPKELAELPDPNVTDTKLRTLFQPDEGLKRLFNVFVEVASVPLAEVSGKFFRTVWSYYKCDFFKGFLLGYIFSGVAALLLSFTVRAVLNCLLTLCQPSFLSLPVSSALATGIHHILFGSIFGNLLGGFVIGFLFLALAIRREYKILARKDGWGFCSGLSTDGSTNEALTDWLHKGIQGAAKLPLGRPLTFQDLWNAPGGPKQDDGQPVQKSIDLRMITTAVSHGRPYELPLADPSVRLFFSLKELKSYFPASIIEHLEKAPKYTEIEKYYAIDPIKNRDRPRSPNPEDKDPVDFRELPRGDLPVLVAVRLSMNFPILFRAVPLVSIDAEAGPVKNTGQFPGRDDAPKFKRTWFTDGGITSNFPVHIFDSPVPAWPTFGVFIEEESRSNKYLGKEKPPCWLPPFHTVGQAEKWMGVKDSDDPVESGNDLTSNFASYVKSVVFTAKDWADNANMRMPGIRDRVVTVYKNGGETNGGLNLKLAPDVIWNLSYRNGVAGGKALAQRFLTDKAVFNENLEGTPGWLDHRWVRFNSYISALKVHLTGFGSAVNAAHATPPITTQIDQAKVKPPLKFDKYFEAKLTDRQANALKKAVGAIQALETALAADTVVQPYTPKPQPELTSKARI